VPSGSAARISYRLTITVIRCLTKNFGTTMGIGAGLDGMDTRRSVLVDDGGTPILAHRVAKQPVGPVRS
jgi:hypothetical protein